MQQMEHYQKFIDQGINGGIVSSYKMVASNYLELLNSGLLPSSYFPDLKGNPAVKVLKDFISDPKIDPLPYLLILGENEATGLTKGKKNQNHWQKLRELFQEDGYPEPIYYQT